MPRRTVDIPALAEGVRTRNFRSLGRAISLVERSAPEKEQFLKELAAGETEAADSAGSTTAGEVVTGAPSVLPRVIGITGPPGVGKSTLTDRLIVRERRAGRHVAVLAVDPSSPFSGGALLGDRVRMDRHSLDDGVFIRSMATRGHYGGLSAAAYDTVTILLSAGFETIIVESVGVGQSETHILTLSDITLVVLNPGAGDDIQALKAGVMEIADIFVLNKADVPGIDDLERQIRSAITPDGTSIPTRVQTADIIRTSARDDRGIDELTETIERRLTVDDASGELAGRRNRRLLAAAEDIAIAVVREWTRRNAEKSLVPLRQRLISLLEGEENEP